MSIFCRYFVTVRRATTEDSDAIAAIFIAARTAALPYLPDLHTDEETHAFFAERVLPNDEVHVAERDGVVVGFAAIEGGRLEHLYVRPDRQGTGVGSRLLDEAKRSRPDGLDLWTFQRNAAARRFYEVRGLVEVESTEGERNEEREPDVRYEWPGRASS